MSIKTIAIIDDFAEARKSYAEQVEDARYIPFMVDSGFKSIDEMITILLKKSEAAIFDYHLNVGNYARFTGAEAIFNLYLKKFPAILVTSYMKADIDRIRPFRKNIPVLIPSQEFESDLIETGIQICNDEFEMKFSSERKPIKTIFRIDEIEQENKSVYITIPAWNPQAKVKILYSMFSTRGWENLKIGDRFLAEINIGAIKDEDLFFDNFMIASIPQDLNG